MPPITSLLVANRGEIARRIFRTARSMGITCVAVYSDADADSPHVAEADLAVRLPGLSPTDTYLRSDLLLDAAARSGADAIHPGYGFLSENAAFAAAVVDAGLTWVGPPAAAIAAMGSKIGSKELMRSAGVPTLPSIIVPDLGGVDFDEADALGWPLLVKASAGGGGRGMRIVEEIGDLAEAVVRAQREAESAFGDGTLFLERYVTDPRHIEVQVLADAHGDVVALFERECSIQRRHQKIIEESPSPVVSPEQRERLCDAATTAARAVGYTNAGTVEFVLDPAGTDPGGSFYFLEMNTRLQVEHPVTELVTGCDLVRLQLLVAEGHPLPDEVHAAVARGPVGHAVEARIYAEDPAADWLPSTGTLHRFEIQAVSSPGMHSPGVAPIPAVSSPGGTISDSPASRRIGPGTPSRFAQTREISESTNDAQTRADTVAGSLGTATLRVDSGVESGSTVSPHYDPMLAKVIVHAPTRAEAVASLARVLATSAIHGVTTNRDLLVRTLRHPDFIAGDIDTGFLDRHGLDVLSAPLADEHALRRHAIAAALTGRTQRRAQATVQPDLPSGWRNNPSQLDQTTFDGPSDPITVGYRFDRTGNHVDLVEVDGVSQPVVARHLGADSVLLTLDGVTRHYRVGRAGLTAFVDGPDGSTTLVEQERFPVPGSQIPAGSAVAPMPGGVARVNVAVGDRVKAGQDLVVLEAMKMEHTVHAAMEGTVAEVMVTPGTQVESGQVLVVLEEIAGSDEQVDDR
jgi:propionyl-CoA carboxylase alpha chain